ncbi:MAG: hypothetical protein R6W82_06310 [bacterium]
MARPLPEDSPWKMDVPTMREVLDGEALEWYERAHRLRGRTLNVKPRERTAFQRNLDEIWEGVRGLARGEEVDTDRLDRIYQRIRKQWGYALDKAPPAPDWPRTSGDVEG